MLTRTKYHQHDSIDTDCYGRMHGLDGPASSASRDSLSLCCHEAFHVAASGEKPKDDDHLPPAVRHRSLQLVMVR